MTEERFSSRTDLAKFLSDISRNSGKVSFVVTYHATDGNLDTDKRFQEFCARHSNNEYLQGIKLLMESFDHYNELKAMDMVVADLNDRVTALEATPVKEERQITKKVF